MSIPHLARLPLVMVALISGPGFFGDSHVPEPKEPLPIKGPARFYYSIYLGEGVRDFSRLELIRTGKVVYYFASDPSSDNGGQIVKKQWQVSPADAAALIEAFAADLAKLDSNAKGKPFRHHLKVGSKFNRDGENIDREVYVAALPARLAQRLLPLLREAHPELWKHRTPANWKVLP